MTELQARVIALLKKHKRVPQGFSVAIEVETSTGAPPAVFTMAVMIFKLEGLVDAEIFKEAVRLSQTKYCGVSAMLSKAFPIEYRLMLNGKEIDRGSSKFNEKESA